VSLRRRRLLVGVVVVVMATLSACAQQEQNQPAVVEVSGDFGRRPQVAFDAPLEITEPESTAIIEGEGKELQDGDPVLLSYLAYSAQSGEVLDESFADEPRALILSSEVSPLYEEVVGRKEGSRILHLSQGTLTRPEPTVVVYDILHTRAWGEDVDPPTDAKSLPKVDLKTNGRPEITIPDADPPSQLRVITLIKGDGPQVQEGGSLTAHYASVSWEDGKEFDSTWAEKLVPPAIPFTGLIPAWQEGLSDATVGSQIMIIARPEDAFGSDTVVFVIDILATTKPEGNADE